MRIIFDLNNRDSGVPIFKAHKMLTLHSIFFIDRVIMELEVWILAMPFKF